MWLDRFCVPAGEDVPVDSGGFLLSPPSWYRRPLPVVPLADACSASAVLLGEAGIGKSHALATVLEASRSAGDRNACVRVDLGEVRSWDDLTRKARLVLGQPVAAGLPQDSGLSDHETVPERLLVLDGIDECQATGKEIAGWFTDLANTYDCRRLQVLIACRSMAYTETMRQAVAAAFGITDARTYTLAPLRQSDLAVVAASKGADPERFLEAVTTAGAQALARTPLTLDLLLNTFLQHSALPASRAELYAFALPHAVMHQGRDRAPDDLAGSQAQRFATAARLASYCLLTGADGITTMRHAEPSRTLLAIDTFLGRRESATGETFTIERPLIESVLHSSLFSSRGPAAAGPAHASIASYLTARHLCDYRVPREQLQGLLIHRGEVGDPGIPTDLHELAAWLVALNPDLGPWLIGIDPQAIASYSSYIDDPHCTSLIVEGLLRQARENTPRNGQFWRHTTPLRHHGLTEQLTRAFGDAVSRPLQGMYELELILALIAENQVVELLPTVAAFAGDAQRPHALRRIAAQCAHLLDQEKAAPLLKPVLAELARHPEHDPDDGLRGAVLETCQPWLTTEELTAALTPPQADPSSYTSFCQSLPDSLTDDQVTPFLDWASTRLMDLNSPWAGWSDADTMTQSLLDRALNGLAAETHIPTVAAWLRPYLRTYPQLAVPAPLCAPLDDPGDQRTRHLRRVLTEHLIDQALDDEDAFQLAEGWDAHARRPFRRRSLANPAEPEREQRTSLLDAGDLAWLVELEHDLSDTKARHAWPALQHVWSMAKATEAGQDTAWTTRNTRVWPHVFAHDFEAIPVDGPLADQLKNREARRQARTQPWEGRAEYVVVTRSLLAQAESGNGDSFVTLCHNLQCDPDTGRFAVVDFGSDLLLLPGTAILADGYERHLLSAARRFITENLPADDSWIGTPNFSWRPWAAVFAFTALLNDGQALTNCPPSQWQAWAPTLLAFPLTSTAAQHTGPRSQLVERCLPHAAQELEDTYDALVRASYAAEEVQPALDLVSSIWTAQLETRLLDTLTDLTTQAHDSVSASAAGSGRCEVLASVLSRLLKYGGAGIRQQALERFGVPLRVLSPTRDERLDAAYLRVFVAQMRCAGLVSVGGRQ